MLVANSLGSNLGWEIPFFPQTPHEECPENHEWMEGYGCVEQIYIDEKAKPEPKPAPFQWPSFSFSEKDDTLIIVGILTGVAVLSYYLYFR